MHPAADRVADGLPIGWVMGAFAASGVGPGLTQPALINTVIGGSGISAVDTGSALGLFLATARSCNAFGVAAIGGVFSLGWGLRRWSRLSGGCFGDVVVYSFIDDGDICAGAAAANARAG